MSDRVFLCFLPRGHKPPPTLRDRLNPHTPCLRRHRFPVPRYAKRPDVILYAIDPLLPLLPIPSSPYCTLKISGHVSLWSLPAAHSDGRPRPQKYSRTQGYLSVLTSSYLEGTVEVIRWWYGLLRCAPMMRSKIRWCTVRNLEWYSWPKVDVLHPYKRASTASVSTVRVLR